MVLFYDDASKFVGMLVQVLQQRQAELIEYVGKTYSNVSVFVQESWIRLDFNHDGSVTMDDLRASATKFYEFLKSYDYIEATTRIKSQIYEEGQRLYRVNLGGKGPATGGDDIPLEDGQAEVESKTKEDDSQSQNTAQAASEPLLAVEEQSIEPEVAEDTKPSKKNKKSKKD